MAHDTAQTKSAGRADGAFSFNGLGITIVLVALIVVFSFINVRFFAIQNFLNILTQAAPFIIMAVGMTFVISAAGIDLSIGAILAVSTVVAFEFMSNGGNPILGVLMLFGIGTFLGSLNGLLVAYASVPPFIATLGMMVSLRGIALLHSAGTMHFGLPKSVAYIGQGTIAGIPVASGASMRAARKGSS